MRNNKIPSIAINCYNLLFGYTFFIFGILLTWSALFSITYRGLNFWAKNPKKVRQYYSGLLMATNLFCSLYCSNKPKEYLVRGHSVTFNPTTGFQYLRIGFRIFPAIQRGNLFKPPSPHAE